MDELAGHRRGLRRLYAGDAWKLIEELIQRLSARQIVEKRANRHTSVADNRFARRYLGIATNDRLRTYLHENGAALRERAFVRRHRACFGLTP